jgi:hypothetical protein
LAAKDESAMSIYEAELRRRLAGSEGGGEEALIDGGRALESPWQLSKIMDIRIPQVSDPAGFGSRGFFRVPLEHDLPSLESCGFWIPPVCQKAMILVFWTAAVDAAAERFKPARARSK